MLRTGWSKRTDPKAYLNVSEDGPHSPGFHQTACELLAHERDILGVGTETVGTDAGQAATFDLPFCTHSIMHGAGRFGLASLCNLDQLPSTGAIVMAAPYTSWLSHQADTSALRGPARSMARMFDNFGRRPLLRRVGQNLSAARSQQVDQS